MTIEEYILLKILKNYMPMIFKDYKGLFFIRNKFYFSLKGADFYANSK